MNLSFLTWNLPEQAGLPDAAAVARDAMPAAGHHPLSAPIRRCGRICSSLRAGAVIRYEVITGADAGSGRQPVIAASALGARA